MNLLQLQKVEGLIWWYSADVCLRPTGFRQQARLPHQFANEMIRYDPMCRRSTWKGNKKSANRKCAIEKAIRKMQSEDFPPLKLLCSRKSESKPGINYKTLDLTRLNSMGTDIDT